MLTKNLELHRLLKVLPLFGFSLTEISVAFVRMFILTHILGSYEFGFAAAISTIYATIGQITDVALYRFVGSNSRSVFIEAIAGAHALSLLRGLLLSCCILIVSRPLACVFTGCEEWPSFAWLALVMMIASFENLEIRVRERDYRYWPQLTASLVSHGSGIIALTVISYETGSHYGFIAYLLIQSTAYTLSSHLLASISYRVEFRSEYLQKAFVFGFPLMMNGIGLALLGQGDRLMVGTLLGLPTLGLYAVIILAGLVPISGISRVLGPLFFAGLHNTQVNSREYDARLRLFGLIVPMIAGGYALVLVGVFKTVLPLVFGSRFMVSDSIVLLIALISFFRIIRIEPHTSLLLNAQKTRELACANLSPAVGLITATALVMMYPSIEATLIGVLVGELAGFFAIIFVTRHLLRRVIANYTISVLIMMTLLAGTGILVVFLPCGDNFLIRTAVAGSSCILILSGAAIFLPKAYRTAYIGQWPTK